MFQVSLLSLSIKFSRFVYIVAYASTAFLSVANHISLYGETAFY